MNDVRMNALAPRHQAGEDPRTWVLLATGLAIVSVLAATGCTADLTNIPHQTNPLRPIAPVEQKPEASPTRPAARASTLLPKKTLEQLVDVAQSQAKLRPAADGWRPVDPIVKTAPLSARQAPVGVDPAAQHQAKRDTPKPRFGSPSSGWRAPHSKRPDSTRSARGISKVSHQQSRAVDAIRLAAPAGGRLPNGSAPNGDRGVVLSLKRSDELSVNIAAPSGVMPEDRAPAELVIPEPLSADESISYGQGELPYWIAPSRFCHQPLYFEDSSLERHGYSRGCLQPMVSAAHFFATVPILPYKMAVDSPHDCALSREGLATDGCSVCQPGRKKGFQWRAGAVEVGTIAGLILLIP